MRKPILVVALLLAAGLDASAQESSGISSAVFFRPFFVQIFS